MNNISSAYNYNDLAGLNAISKQSASDEAGALKEVARQFESMFVGMMLKSMRDANAVFEEDNPLFSNESKFYREMFDEQLTLSLSKGKGMGLADTLYRQMQHQFDIKEADKKNLNEVNTHKEFNLKKQPNPFSSLHPALDLPQFKASDSAPLGHDNIQGQTIAAPINLPPLSVEKPTADEALTKSPVVKQSGFTTPQDFIATLWPMAQKVGADMQVAPKAILAQAALETGWGKHIIHQSDGNNSHNLFGIKADRRWGGEVAKVSTLEYRDGLAKKEQAPFRVYESYEASLKDYAHFIQGSDRYQGAVKNGHSIKGYSEGLQAAGYATDPNYANKIQRIAGGELLNQAIDQVKKG
ncbi:MAG: flagellar assembly peptidoglycan hydrolase FlgJ [Bermanella sp.]